jgi:hypothetical protein
MSMSTKTTNEGFKMVIWGEMRNGNVEPYSRQTHLDIDAE